MSLLFFDFTRFISAGVKVHRRMCVHTTLRYSGSLQSCTLGALLGLVITMGVADADGHLHRAIQGSLILGPSIIVYAYPGLLDIREGKTGSDSDQRHIASSRGWILEP